ncbi:hypothetical protein N8T08_005828 [Aspergillus melleus]|uniref:Uncharacterized protein n=1 Tax=Aspergillus melleus TaxID=138277 RepID=A0ACC3B1G3_9EURO|nr:hypothetical protein N8T08_005828 [Aspergillus melleus]
MFYRDLGGRDWPLVPIVVKQQRELSKGMPQLLGYMLVVSNKIKEKEGVTKPVYGLLSDGNQFEFYRLDEELRYDVEILHWGHEPKQQKEIVYLLYHILNDHGFNDAAPMPPPCPVHRMIEAASSGDPYSLYKLSRLGRRRAEEDSMDEA